MQKVAACAKRADPECTEGAARDIAAPLSYRPLLLQAVNEEAAAAIHAAASRVEGTAQFRLVLGMPGGHMEVMQSMSKLAAFGILAGTSFCIATAQLGLVASGAEPRVKRWRFNQRKQSFSQGLTTRQALWEDIVVTIQRKQQVILASLRMRN